ncbi:MAG: glucokinase [Saprospiraceae bacterium]|nr:glucokinase [Saprospiraceae bacterium]
MKKYLALDVGGTKTHIALFSANDSEQINIIKENKYRTQEAKSLEEIVLDFSPDMKDVEGMSIAVAGPVINNRAQLTNVSWSVDKDRIIDVTGVRKVELLNDLEASAFGIPFMMNSDLMQIFKAEERMAGNMAIIAPGTGLGEAAMYWDGKAYHPFASEGGHCDFSPRDKTDINMLMFLQHKFGHVSWERVVSGQGIVNIFDFLRTSSEYNLDTELETKLLQGDAAANISRAALEGERVAMEAMELFVRYLAIESANMALKFKSTGGLFIGGGIIPKVWNESYRELFLKYFFDVGRLEPLLRCVDVTIVLNPISVLFGAAHYLVSREA